MVEMTRSTMCDLSKSSLRFSHRPTLFSAESLFFSLLTALAVLLSVPSARAGDAPEFQWGMQVQDIEKKGKEVTLEREIGRFSIYRMDYAPEYLPATDLFLLIMDRDYGLVKTVWKGAEILGDADGDVGRRRFLSLEERLSELLGTPKRIQELDAAACSRPESFYLCLCNEGTGLWISLWEPSWGVVGLQLVGRGPGRGFPTLTRESAEFETALSEQDKRLDRRIEDALKMLLAVQLKELVHRP